MRYVEIFCLMLQALPHKYILLYPSPQICPECKNLCILLQLATGMLKGLILFVSLSGLQDGIENGL